MGGPAREQSHPRRQEYVIKPSHGQAFQLAREFASTDPKPNGGPKFRIRAKLLRSFGTWCACLTPGPTGGQTHLRRQRYVAKPSHGKTFQLARQLAATDPKPNGGR